MLSNAYGLNFYPPNNNNCDLYPVSGNEYDALNSLTAYNPNLNIYYIRLVNYNLYLTAASNSSGAGVYWVPYPASTAQRWKLEKVSSGGGSGNYLTYPRKVMRIT